MVTVSASNDVCFQMQPFCLWQWWLTVQIKLIVSLHLMSWPRCNEEVTVKQKLIKIQSPLLSRSFPRPSLQSSSSERIVLVLQIGKNRTVAIRWIDSHLKIGFVPTMTERFQFVTFLPLRLRTFDFWMTWNKNFLPKVNRVRWGCYSVQRQKPEKW